MASECESSRAPKPKPNCIACSGICTGKHVTKLSNILARTSTVLSKVLNDVFELKVKLIPKKAKDENRVLCEACSKLLAPAFNAHRKFLKRIKEGSYLQQQRINSSKPTPSKNQFPLDPYVNQHFSEASSPFGTFNNVTPGSAEASTNCTVQPSTAISGSLSFGTSDVSFSGQLILSSIDSTVVNTACSQQRSHKVRQSKESARLTRKFQNLERCCNCHGTGMDQVKGRRLADVLCRKLIPTSGGNHGGTLRYVEVTVLGGLDIMFEVKRNSQFSNIMLDENYCLCNRCTAMLVTLFDFYLHFIDSTKSPSFLQSTFVFNEALSVFQNSLTASDGGGSGFPDLESDPAQTSNAKPGSGSSRNVDVNHENDLENALLQNQNSFQGTDTSDNQLQLPESEISVNISRVSNEKVAKHHEDRSGNRICLDCFMVFTTNVALRDHRETHKNPVIYCPHCKAGFHCKWTLDRHQSQVHPYTVDTQAMLLQDNLISTENPGQPVETFLTQKIQVQSALLALWEEQLKNLPLEPVTSAQPIESPIPPIHMQAAVVNHPENHYAPQLISTNHDYLGAENQVTNPIEIARIQKKRKSFKKKQSGQLKANVKAKKRTLVSANSSLNREHQVKNSLSELFGPIPEIIMYQCPSPNCPQKFLESTLLQQHIPLHAESNHSCPVCQAGFVSSEDLDSHLIILHCVNTDEMLKEKDLVPSTAPGEPTIDRKWECTQCDLTFFHISYATHHMDHFHNRSISKFCPLCYAIVTSEEDQAVHTNYRMHRKKRRAQAIKRRFPCEHCEKSYPQMFYLREHIYLNYNDGFKEPEFPCHQCDYVALTRSRLNGHKQRHHPSSGSVICPECGRSFKSKFHLKEHAMLHTFEADHSFRPFPCPFDGCNKRYYRLSALNIHKRLHKEPKYICEECGKRFYVIGELRNHIKSRHRVLNESEPDYGLTCDICGCRGYKKHSLSAHKAKEHGIRRRRGKRCRKRAARLDADTDRNKVSTPLCEEAGKILNTMDGLRSHRRKGRSSSLKQKRPVNCFKCSCGVKSDSYKEHFEHRQKKHGAKHRNLGTQKPCPKCGRLFLRKCYLDNHIKICNGHGVLGKRGYPYRNRANSKYPLAPSGLYKCPHAADCEMEFTNARQVQNHLYDSHSYPRPQITAKRNNLKGIYKCLECDKQFNFKSSMNKHRLRRHPSMVVAEEVIISETGF